MHCSRIKHHSAVEIDSTALQKR